MAKELTIEEVREMLNKACEKAGGGAAFATAHGLSRQFVWQVRQGVRQPSQELCAALGLKELGRRWVKA